MQVNKLNREVVFDRKNGHIGIRRSATKKEISEHSVNYMVDILDPDNLLHVDKTVPGFGEETYDWCSLPKKDPRTQLIMLFDIIEDRSVTKWFFSGWEKNEEFEVEEAYVENRHEVFELVRKLFK